MLRYDTRERKRKLSSQPRNPNRQTKETDRKETQMNHRVYKNEKKENPCPHQENRGTHPSTGKKKKKGRGQLTEQKDSDNLDLITSCNDQHTKRPISQSIIKKRMKKVRGER